MHFISESYIPWVRWARGTRSLLYGIILSYLISPDKVASGYETISGVVRFNVVTQKIAILKKIKIKMQRCKSCLYTASQHLNISSPSTCHPSFFNFITNHCFKTSTIIQFFSRALLFSMFFWNNAKCTNREIYSSSGWGALYVCDGLFPRMLMCFMLTYFCLFQPLLVF